MSKPVTNSRFAVLLEDTQRAFTKHNKKNNKDKNNKSESNYKYDNKTSKSKEEKSKEEKPKEEKLITGENFPKLSDNKPIQSNLLEDKSYIEKVKTVKPLFTDQVSHIKPGWIEIKREHKTKKIITTYNNDLNDSNNENNESNKNILTALVHLYNKRKNEYIDLWGYDQWEKMFISPTYDYEYFDRLDEKYNEEQNEIDDYVNE